MKKITLFKVIDGQKYEYGTYNPEQPSELTAMVTAIAYITKNGIDVKAEVVGD